jgi:adenylosuccinate synthase
VSYTAVVGLQWGDEGKGKVVDHLAADFDIIARFQGGANAGHTIVVDGKKHALHLLPSGLIRPDKIGVIGAGVVLDTEILLKEIRDMAAISGPLEGRFLIDGRAHVVMPYHKLEDQWEETLKGGLLGTTKMGIGQAYRDRYARFGLRLIDLADRELLRKRLENALSFNNQIIGARYGKPPLDLETLLEELLKFYEQVKPYVSDVARYLNEAHREGRKILLEGAQAALLDVVFGSYPFVTSSHTVAGGASVGLGIPPGSIETVVGVCKAYSTRVGKGPFPTELDDETGKHLREQGLEFGTTTGRPRRCGWLDLVYARYSAALSGVTGLALTKLDVLSGVREIKVATRYRMDGEETDWPPMDLACLGRCEPVYETLPGFDDLGDPKKRSDLPEAARSYLTFIEDHIGVRIDWISIGREREAIFH